MVAEDEYEAALMQLEKLLPAHKELFDMLLSGIMAMKVVGGEVAYRAGLRDGLALRSDLIFHSQTFDLTQ